MKLVVDANILFSFFWRDCFTRRVLTGGYFELVAPEFILEEVGKYKGVIMKKVGVDSDEFDRMRRELILYVEFFGLGYYKKFLKEGVKICPDLNDVDYSALALRENVSVWSNNKKLKCQSVVKVLSTEEVIGLS